MGNLEGWVLFGAVCSLVMTVSAHSLYSSPAKEPVFPKSLGGYSGFAPDLDRSGHISEAMKTARKSCLETADYLSRNGFTTLLAKIGLGYDYGEMMQKPEVKAFLREFCEEISARNLRLVITFYPINVRDAANPLHRTFPAYVDQNGVEYPKRFCLYDADVWEKVCASLAFDHARLSLDAPVEGVGMDLETIYNNQPCYCDKCWQRFIRSVGQETSVPEQPSDKRLDYLRKHNLAGRYVVLAEAELGRVVAGLRDKLHLINPRLKLGFMPVQDSLFFRPFIKNFGTRETPAFIDSWIMYDNGFREAVIQEQTWIKRMNPYVLYIPWLRVNNYIPADIPAQAYYAAMNTDGYNMWEPSMFLCDRSKAPAVFHLPPGTTQEEYARAFGAANQEIRQKVAVGEKYQTKLVLRFSPIKPPTDTSKWKKVELIPLNYAGEYPAAPDVRPVCFRDVNTFLIYIGAPGEKIGFVIEHLAGERKANAVSYAVIGPDGTRVADGAVHPGKREEISLPAKAAGTYTVFVNGGSGGGAWYGVKVISPYYVLKAEPASIFPPQNENRHFFRYFYVPAGTGVFTIADFTACGTLQCGNLQVVSPAGEVMADVTVYDSERRKIDVAVPKGLDGKVWAVLIGPPKKMKSGGYYYQDIMLSLGKGLAPYISDRPERLLVPKTMPEPLSETVAGTDHNLLLNPDFEILTAGGKVRSWGEKCETDGSHNHTPMGTRSLKMTGEPGNNWLVVNGGGFIVAEPGRNYRFSGHCINNATKGEILLGIREIKADGQTRKYNWVKVPPGDMEWKKYSFDFSPSQETAKLLTYFYLNRVSGEVWFDDISLSGPED